MRRIILHIFPALFQRAARSAAFESEKQPKRRHGNPLAFVGIIDRKK